MREGHSDSRNGRGYSKGHAVVIGGRRAGLLAARVLSESFERVSIVERDRFPEGIENRKGVPQGRHVHVLLPRGHMVLERLFPGLTRELVARGAMTGDLPAEGRWYQPSGGGVMAGNVDR